MSMTVLILVAVLFTFLAKANGHVADRNTNYIHTFSNIEYYLGKRLSAYELIDAKRVVAKRSLGMETETIALAAFNRTFKLVLAPTQTDSVSPDLAVTIMDPVSGTNERMNVSSLMADFFSGYVDGEPASKVTGFYANNQFVCTVHTGNGMVLNIESVSILTGNLSETRLLAYYDNHLRDSSQSDEPTGCGFDELPPPPPPPPPKHRRRRSDAGAAAASAADADHLLCSLQLVADHSFYGRLGVGQLGATVRSMVKTIDDVNNIFRATKFIDPATGRHLPQVGFELASIVVFTRPSEQADHFNAQAKEATLHKSSNFLEAFSDFAQTGINFTAYCINHLLTFKRMDRNVLGLAYLGSMCRSASFYSRSGRRGRIAQNVGFTTHSDMSGFPLFFRRATLVTAHELGHNLGSNHDPAGKPECTPSTSQGGYYIMYERSVLGYTTNNDKFSPCSVRDMSQQILIFRDDCLRRSKSGLCGNRRLDAGEQCDSGAGGDACCDGDCRLRLDAKCSDAQSPCCFECKVAPKGAVCLGPSPLRPCQGPGHCDGVSLACPGPTPSLPDGSECQSGAGVCLSGACLSACHPGVKCECPDSGQVCQLCCAGRGGGACAPKSRPNGGGRIPLPIESPCEGGRCLGNGTCVSEAYFSGRPLVRLFQENKRSGGGSFAVNNIVIIVLGVTLLLWVPASLLCHYQDRRQIAREYNGDGTDADITFDVTEDPEALTPSRASTYRD